MAYCYTRSVVHVRGLPLSLSVCVCLLVTSLSHTKMADRSRCRGDVGAKKPGIRWEPISPHWKGHLLTTVIVVLLGHIRYSQPYSQGGSSNAAYGYRYEYSSNKLSYANNLNNNYSQMREIIEFDGVDKLSCRCRLDGRFRSEICDTCRAQEMCQIGRSRNHISRRSSNEHCRCCSGLALIAIRPA